MHQFASATDLILRSAVYDRELFPPKNLTSADSSGRIMVQPTAFPLRNRAAGQEEGVVGNHRTRQSSHGIHDELVPDRKVGQECSIQGCGTQNIRVSSRGAIAEGPLQPYLSSVMHRNTIPTMTAPSATNMRPS
jgi:hypothetical protein